MLSLILPSLPALANSFTQTHCVAGEELGRLKGENFRTMFFTYHNGYLVQNRHGGSMTKVWDISNPSSPQLLRSYDNNLWEGQHTHTFIGQTELYHWSGKHQIDLSKLPDLSEADPIFNADDMVNSYYPFGFANVANSYQYEKTGYFTIHDLRTADQEELSRVEVMSDTGFEGHINLIGNLMIVTGDNETPQGLATYDLSNPRKPVLLDSIRTTEDGTPLIKAYDSVPVWGTYAFLIQNGDTTAQRGVDVIDFSNPQNLKHVGRFDFEGRTRYAQFQDHYMYVGDAKVDLRTFETVATYPEGGGEYALPLGNLLVTAGMHRADNGRIWCQNSEPDTSAPFVTFHSPANNATNLAVSSRVGVVIPETLDINTINKDNIVLRPLYKSAIEVDIVSSDHDVINVTPKRELQTNATYEFIIFAGGLKDISGNAMKEDFRIVFSTGDGINLQQPPEIEEFSISQPSCKVCQTINATIHAKDSNKELQYSFDWGDGKETDFSSSNTHAHQYQKPGIYSVQAKVKNNAGLQDIQTRTVVVANTKVERGVTSSSIIYDQQNNLIWNVNPDNNSVSATNTQDELVYEIDVARNPQTLSQDLSGNIWVSSEDDAIISVIDALRGKIIDTITLPPGSRPFGIVHSTKHNAAYISAMGTGYIYKIDTQNRIIKNSLQVGPWPRAMALNHDGTHLLVTRFISPDHQGEVYSIDTQEFTAATIIPMTMDEHTDSDRNGKGLPNYLTSIAISPDGKTAWVGSKKDNILRGGMRDGYALSFENTVRSILSFIDIEQKMELTEMRIDIDNHELPSAIQFSNDGAIAYISYRGNDSVTAYSSEHLQILDRITSGKTPLGLALSPNSPTLYIHNYLSRSIQNATLYTGPQASLDRFSISREIATVSNEALSEQVLLGKQLFNSASDPRISRDGYISCASCHLDGEHDGRTWDFSDRGEGLRNTISLRGRAGTAHGRLHWSANFDEIQDFEHDIRGAFSGRGLMDDKDFDDTANTLDQHKTGRSEALDAIAAYAQSLNEFGISPLRNQDTSLSTQAKAGKTLFQQLNCSSCHTGEAFTDSPLGLRHDVGTIKASSGFRLNSGRLTGVDTPTLKGLWNSEPYFHDGSAESLLDVINTPSHGNAQNLSDSKKQQLLSFLKQIDDLETPGTEQLPILAVSSFEQDASLDPQNIQLSIKSNLDDIQSVIYYANDEEIARSNNTPFTTHWQSDSPGRQRIYAKVLHSNGAASISKDTWVNVIGKSLTCEIATIDRWTGGFVAKDILVKNVGNNTMRDWNVQLTFSQDVQYREAWDTVVEQQSERVFEARGYSDDRDLMPGESIAFGFIVLHKAEVTDIVPECYVANALLPEPHAESMADNDNDRVDDRYDLCPDSPSTAIVNALGCSQNARDSDNDGVVDGQDRCLHSEKHAPVDNYGCSIQQRKFAQRLEQRRHSLAYESPLTHTCNEAPDLARESSSHSASANISDDFF